MTFPRRARPTLRVLRDDLRDGWEGPRAQPGFTGLDPLLPLSDLPHPIIAKAAESFSSEPVNDLHEGAIRSATRVSLLEIRRGQWRGAVWIDEGGAPWLVAVGLAKGGHADHDGFYEAVKRADESGAVGDWLPTDEDRRQLKREQAAALLPDWELEIPRRTLAALESIATGGEVELTLPHPRDSTQSFGSATILVERHQDPDYVREDLFVEFSLEDRFRASGLCWTALTRVLIAISPPETSWDRVGDTFSTVEEIGRTTARIEELREITDRGELVRSRPNDRAHYAHRRNLSDAAIDGIAVRSMCGVYFVQTQDWETLEHCEICEERWAALP